MFDIVIAMRVDVQVLGERGQSAVGGAQGEVLDCRFSTVPVGVRADGPPRSRRSVRATVRSVGTGEDDAGVLARRGGPRRGNQQTNPRSPHAKRARGSPGDYFQTLQVERAIHLLKTGNASVDEVAARVGYAEGATLRTVLPRRLHMGITEIRKPSARTSAVR
jgi:hypothetical protein